MKYVKPHILYKETLKKTNNLLNNDAIGVQLLGLNFLSDYVSIAIADHDLDVGLPYGIVEKKGRNIRKLTKVLQTLIPRYNIEAAVIGCPNTKNMENLEVLKVKSFVYDLYKTEKFKGLKYTYWDRRIKPKYWTELLMKADPDLPDDHPENNIEDFDDRQSAVYILQSYIDHTGMVKSKGQKVKGRGWHGVQFYSPPNSGLSITSLPSRW